MSEYAKINNLYKRQSNYILSYNTQKENFGAFSISAAVRGGCGGGCANPWYRGSPCNINGVS